MKSHNADRQYRPIRTKLAIALTSVLVAMTACAAPELESEPGKVEMEKFPGLTEEQAQVVAKAKEEQAAKSYSEQEQAAIDLAIRTVNESTSVSRDSISHLRIRSVQWPDSSLGCAEPGMQYLQRVTPGYMVSFTANEKIYTVHTGDGSAIVCERFNDLMTERQQRGRAVIKAHETARTDLAKRLMVDVEMIKVTTIKAETWPDSSLGCPVAGEQYVQGQVEGLIINMTCLNRQYEYRVTLGGGDFKSCQEIVSCHETE